MNTMLHDLITRAYRQSDSAYTESIKAREQMDDLVAAVPVENEALYQRASAIRERCVQAINAASQARRAIDELMSEL